MSEENINEETGAVETPKIDELTALKKRADMMGITYHPSIGVDKLKAKIDAKLNSEGADDVLEVTEKAEPVKETPAQVAVRLRKECSKLVRVQITCRNPNKQAWEGEIFTVANRVVGTFKKFVMFNVPWHVPEFILKMIEERKYQTYYTVVENGHKIRRSKLVKEFTVDYLDPLTYEELKDLAIEQARSNRIDRPDAA